MFATVGPEYFSDSFAAMYKKTKGTMSLNRNFIFLLEITLDNIGTSLTVAAGTSGPSSVLSFPGSRQVIYSQRSVSPELV